MLDSKSGVASAQCHPIHWSAVGCGTTLVSFLGVRSPLRRISWQVKEATQIGERCCSLSVTLYKAGQWCLSYIYFALVGFISHLVQGRPMVPVLHYLCATIDACVVNVATLQYEPTKELRAESAEEKVIVCMLHDPEQEQQFWHAGFEFGVASAQCHPVHWSAVGCGTRPGWFRFWE